MDCILIDLDDTLLVEVASATAAMKATARVAAEKYSVDTDQLVDAVFSEAKPLWYGAPARDYCVRIGVSSWEGLWARFEGDDPDLAALRNFAPTYRFSAWQAALCSCGIDDPDLAGALAETFPLERRKRHVIFENSEPVLQALEGRFKLGLITNGLSCLQREKIQGSGLAHYFDTIVISGDLGRCKPDPFVFEHALRRLGGTPDRALMVGNSVKSDIAGAHAAGISAVLVDRGDPHGADPTIIPDHIINTLTQLRYFLGI
ncbi:MAG: HAD family hydrolase [Myxococcota bacterium]|nr:HAD family hydrolase [Myxococcota bacterium]